MTNAFFDHPYLSGHHLPNRFEADAPDLIVEGNLPDDLKGVFYRNGAEPLYPPREGDYHWFDGDGMIYGFFIADGKVAMRNRWVRTDKFNLELEAGKRLFGLFGNPTTSDPASQGTRYNTANTNIILHGGKLLALMEGAPAVAMDPRTLETMGEHTYGGAITTTFSAHPKLDHFNGEMVNLGAMINGATGTPEIRYDVISRIGEIIKTEFFEAPHMAPMHTFFLSKNWVVFPVTPIDVSVQRAQSGGPMTAWMPNRSVKLGIMPRNGTPDQMRWIEMEPRHMYHELNVWEEGDTLYADVATSNGTALFPNENGERLTHGETVQSLRRWEIDLSGKSDAVKETILNDRDIQFPRTDDRFMTRKTRQSFANINLNSRDGRIEGMDGVLRFDTVTGTEDLYHFGNGTAAGELIFAPKNGCTNEGEGYAMTLIHPANSATSELVIFAANDIAEGPIARVIIPFRISSGFHCNYYSADSDLYTSAFA